MPRSSEDTRSRIVGAAHGAFWRHGFVRASLDDIADEANVTKRTLYQHFRSKDDLMAAVLLQASELSLARLQRYFDQPFDTPAAVIDSLFSELAQWAAKPRWTGAGFTRVAIELADLPGHPARAVARRHKQMVEASFAKLLRKTGIAADDVKAREVMLIWEGAMTLSLIHGDRNYIPAAAKAARQLFEAARPPVQMARARTGAGKKACNDAASAKTKCR